MAVKPPERATEVMAGSPMRMPIEIRIRPGWPSSTAISGVAGTGLIGGWVLGLPGAVAGMVVGLVVGALVHHYAAVQEHARPQKGPA
jgi:hypothetical protein